jgi:hypothetical protein
LCPKLFTICKKFTKTTIENNWKHQFELFHWPQFKPMGLLQHISAILMEISPKNQGSHAFFPPLCACLFHTLYICVSFSTQIIIILITMLESLSYICLLLLQKDYGFIPGVSLPKKNPNKSFCYIRAKLGLVMCM